MRRLIAALTIVFIGLWATGAPAWAVTETQELNNTVTGPFTGTSQIGLSSIVCEPDEFLNQVMDVTVRPAPDNPHQPRMLGTLHIDFCARFIQGNQAGWRGTFVFTSSRGATLNGTATGTTDTGSMPFPFVFTLRVISGTSSFKNVTGHIDLSGTWQGGPPHSVTGTSTGALQRPK